MENEVTNADKPVDAGSVSETKKEIIISADYKEGHHVYHAISVIRAKLAEKGIGKDKFNEQQKFDFRGIDDVYNAISLLMAEQKICPIPNYIERTCESRPTKSGGIQYCVVLTVEITFVSAIDGSTCKTRYYGEGMDAFDKATNKSMSIAHKYFFLQMFTVPVKGMDDPDQSTPEETAAPKNNNNQRPQNGQRPTYNNNQKRPNNYNNRPPQHNKPNNQAKPSGNQSQLPPPEKDPKLTDAIIALEDSSSLDELKSIFESLDKQTKARLIAIKDRVKARLERGSKKGGVPPSVADAFPDAEYDEEPSYE